MLLGFCAELDVVAAPGKDHDQPVGLLVLLSVKLMHAPAQTVVLLAVKAATGGNATAGMLNVISSTANEGSVPTPSSLFVQLNPILTFALLSHAAGSTIV
jgi:hypothetical protein